MHFLSAAAAGIVLKFGLVDQSGAIPRPNNRNP
jgi:hypothetical protein